MEGHYHLEFERPEDLDLGVDEEYEERFINEKSLDEAIRKGKEVGTPLLVANFQCQFGCGQDHPLKAAEVERLTKEFPTWEKIQTHKQLRD